MPAPPELLRRERRAKREAIAVGAVGVATLVGGVWAAFSGPPPGFAWLITLVIVGPILVFLAFLGYATYLENVEGDRYFHDDFRAAGARHGPH